MPKRTKLFGAFTSKTRARKRSRRVGGKVKAISVGGRRRYLVTARKKRRR
jgi:hypothetical protein